MPCLKSSRVSFNRRKAENSRSDGLRCAIFIPKDLQSDKGYYKGEWKSNKKDGKGKEMKKDGFMYEGDWLNSQKHGYGVLSKVSEAGSIQKCYAGNWLAGKKHGIGCSWYQDGSYYEGMFYQNRRQGYGRIWYRGGAYYQGTWKNDLYDGIGMLVQENGNRYEGQFVKGKMEGCGIFYHLCTGQMQHGFWKDNLCVRGTIEDSYWRQSALNTTPYPIPKNELVPHGTCVFKSIENSDESPETGWTKETCKISKHIKANVRVFKNAYCLSV